MGRRGREGDDSEMMDEWEGQGHKSISLNGEKGQCRCVLLVWSLLPLLFFSFFCCLLGWLISNVNRELKNHVTIFSSHFLNVHSGSCLFLAGLVLSFN